jgi:uncharacterized membrane protein YgcG
MKRKLLLFAAVLVLCCTIFGFCASAAGSPKVYILDQANALSSANMPVIKQKAEEIAAKTGFNIVIAASDDVGPDKSDDGVVEYADSLYEEKCGINTDGILFLMNLDTKYDYISTSGVCINYFSDARIDSIFDDIWDYLVDENYDQAAYSFLLRVDYYYGLGKANNQQEILGREVDVDPFDLPFMMFMPVVIGIFIGSGIFAAKSAQFKMQKPATRNYILNNSLVFDNRSEVFVGTTVDRVYTGGSSSSGHRSGGRSHHSSTHHSHSGGRHGGGGRHR